MHVARVDVYGYDLTYVYGSYMMSGGREIVSLPSTVVRVTTDDGTQGFGETCPLGPAYLPAHGEGARAALRELAPALLGLDPREHARRQRPHRRGAARARVREERDRRRLLGRARQGDWRCRSASCSAVGRQASYPLYVAVPLGPAEEMAAYVARAAPRASTASS